MCYKAIGKRGELVVKATKLGNRFFESTRGQIVGLLRGVARTVEDLAARLELTDNAVRAHLATLERDGLVRQAGVQRGARRPHFTYTLTPEAEHLFPKAYDALLNVLLSVLKGRLAPGEVDDVLRETGRRLAHATETASASGDENAEARAWRAAKVLENLGGAPEIEKDDDKMLIRSASCPLAALVEENPEVCRLAERLVAEITGGRVRERCNRTESPPQCFFEISEMKKRSK